MPNVCRFSFLVPGVNNDVPICPHPAATSADIPVLFLNLVNSLFDSLFDSGCLVSAAPSRTDTKASSILRHAEMFPFYLYRTSSDSYMELYFPYFPSHREGIAHSATQCCGGALTEFSTLSRHHQHFSEV